MKTYDQFLLLSNSKLQGKTVCRYMNGEKGVVNDNNLPLFLKAMDPNRLSSIKEEMKNRGIVCFEPLLNDIYNPPPYLYKRGCGRLLKSVAIIGARDCSPYGRKMAYDIAYELAKANIQIVSGLAYGIDIMAHKGALEAGGSTIAVLGSGILNCYPQKHIDIYNAILKDGLIISEYALHGKPLKHHFPFRNRLISALADVIVVVEAKEKSGTMITVNYALDQGKNIIAVPGEVNSVYSKGTNRLIRDGARIFTSIEDILDELVTIT
jgi:DNA processing protein